MASDTHLTRIDKTRRQILKKKKKKRKRKNLFHTATALSTSKRVGIWAPKTRTKHCARNHGSEVMLYQSRAEGKSQYSYVRNTGAVRQNENAYYTVPFNTNRAVVQYSWGGEATSTHKTKSRLHSMGNMFQALFTPMHHLFTSHAANLPTHGYHQRPHPNTSLSKCQFPSRIHHVSFTNHRNTASLKHIGLTRRIGITLPSKMT